MNPASIENPLKHHPGSLQCNRTDPLASVQNPFIPNQVERSFIRRLSLGLCLVFVIAAEVFAMDLESDEKLQAKRDADSVSLRIGLNNGSWISVTTSDQMIKWTDLTQVGRMVDRQIPLSEVSQAVVGKTSISEKMVLVRNLVRQLEGDDYLARESAERELSKPETGGRFRALIEAEKEHPKLEVRYRIKRILDEIIKFDSTQENVYDQLQLKDGSWLHGDIGDISLQCDFQGKPLTFMRSEIELLLNRKNSKLQWLAPTRSMPPDVEVFHELNNGFLNADQTLIDFQTTPKGDLLASRADVTNAFVPLGLRIFSSKPGYVGISGYAFRTERFPPKENSICIFESTGSAYQRYKGIMEFRFCMPNNRAIPAGVHEFGLFSMRVDMPRDFIMEAYDANGLLLGTAEASDNGCSFHGIRSSVPIALIRYLSNPYLYRVSRKVDEDYCIDDVRFSAPVPIGSISSDKKNGIALVDGDRLIGSILIAENEVQIGMQQGNSVTVPLDQVRSIQFANAAEPATKGQRLWQGMLPDQTVLNVDPKNKFRTALFGGVDLRAEEIAALWLAPNQIRFPLKQDLASLNPKSKTGILVFPTCRYIVSGLTNKPGDGFVWTKSELREQNLWIKDEDNSKTLEELKGEGYEDPNPTLDELDFDKTSVEQIPTLWFNSLTESKEGVGSLLLVDGQRIVLSGEAGFKLEKLDSNSISVSWRGKTEAIPTARVVSIELPKR